MPGSFRIEETQYKEFPQALASVNNGLHLVQTHVEEGMQDMHSISLFFSQLSSLFTSFADHVIELVHQQRDSQISTRKGFGGLSDMAWRSTLVAITTAAKRNREFGEMIMQDLAEPFEDFVKGSEADVREGRNGVKYSQNVFKSVKKELKNRRKTCIKAARTLKNPHLADLKKNFFSSSRISLKAKKISTAKLQDSLDICEEYFDSIQNANTYLRTLYSRDFPYLLMNIQKLEEARLNTLRTGFSLLSEELESLKDGYQEAFSELNQGLNNMNTKEEIRNIVKTITGGIDEEQDVEHFKTFNWDLPETIFELRRFVRERRVSNLNQDAETYEEKSRLFDMTIEDIMRQQLILVPNLRVPEIMARLLLKLDTFLVRELDGIFRRSPDAIQLSTYKSNIEDGVYELEYKDPHIFAGMLKKWLASLPKSLFPEELYDDCIKIVLLDALIEEKKKILECSIFTQMPESHTDVLLTLLEYLTRILQFEEFTRMDSVNLGIVFGPCIMRTDSSDTAYILQNAPYESNFATLLIDMFSPEELAPYRIRNDDLGNIADEKSEFTKSSLFRRRKSKIQEREIVLRKRSDNRSIGEEILLDPLSEMAYLENDEKRERLNSITEDIKIDESNSLSYSDHKELDSDSDEKTRLNSDEAFDTSDKDDENRKVEDYDGSDDVIDKEISFESFQEEEINMDHANSQSKMADHEHGSIVMFDIEDEEND